MKLMSKSLVLLCLIFVFAHAAQAIELDTALEDTVIFFRQDPETTLRNRFRINSVLTDERFADWSATLILDNNTGYTAENGELWDRPLVNRAYVQYAGEKHLLVVGRQRVPFGVGRVWNPIDRFNPIDVLSIEPEERPGTEAIRYEYAINELSNLDCTVSVDKSAARIKTFQETADLALVLVVDTDNHQDIIGWEAAGELFATGIELRSEGGRFRDTENGASHVEAIVGAEYGFVNSLTLLTEYLHNQDTHANDLALSASYQISMLLYFSALAIYNLDDDSTCLAPSLEYSLADDMTLSGGVFFYNGESGDEFGELADQYYVRWFVNF